MIISHVHVQITGHSGMLKELAHEPGGRPSASGSEAQSGAQLDAVVRVFLPALVAGQIKAQLDIGGG